MCRKPSKLIIHAGTNDAMDKSADEILFELLQLKAYVKQRIGITAIISCPTIRTDNTKAKQVVSELCVKLNKLNVPIICNINISDDCLGKGGKHPGLHLNPKGCGRLATNYISYNRRH